MKAGSTPAKVNDEVFKVEFSLRKFEELVRRAKTGESFHMVLFFQCNTSVM